MLLGTRHTASHQGLALVEHAVSFSEWRHQRVIWASKQPVGRTASVQQALRALQPERLFESLSCGGKPSLLGAVIPVGCAAGYYYDAGSGYYYDANSGLYFDSASQCWLAQDPVTGEYAAYTPAASEAPAASYASAGVSTAAQAAACAAPQLL